MNFALDNYIFALELLSYAVPRKSVDVLRFAFVFPIEAFQIDFSLLHIVSCPPHAASLLPAVFVRLLANVYFLLLSSNNYLFADTFHYRFQMLSASLQLSWHSLEHFLHRLRELLMELCNCDVVDIVQYRLGMPPIGDGMHDPIKLIRLNMALKILHLEVFRNIQIHLL